MFLASGLAPLTSSENDAECPIDRIAVRDPVRTTCGHVYCADCLLRWFEVSNACPLCRRELFSTSDTVTGWGQYDDPESTKSAWTWLWDAYIGISA